MYRPMARAYPIILRCAWQQPLTARRGLAATGRRELSRPVTARRHKTGGDFRGDPAASLGSYIPYYAPACRSRQRNLACTQHTHLGFRSVYTNARGRHGAHRTRHHTRSRRALLSGEKKRELLFSSSLRINISRASASLHTLLCLPLFRARRLHIRTAHRLPPATPATIHRLLYRRTSCSFLVAQPRDSCGAADRCTAHLRVAFAPPYSFSISCARAHQSVHAPLFLLSGRRLGKLRDAALCANKPAMP